MPSAAASRRSSTSTAGDSRRSCCAATADMSRRVRRARSRTRTTSTGRWSVIGVAGGRRTPRTVVPRAAARASSSSVSARNGSRKKYAPRSRGHGSSGSTVTRSARRGRTRVPTRRASTCPASPSSASSMRIRFSTSPTSPRRSAPSNSSRRCSGDRDAAPPVAAGSSRPTCPSITRSALRRPTTTVLSWRPSSRGGGGSATRRSAASWRSRPRRSGSRRSTAARTSSPAGCARPRAATPRYSVRRPRSPRSAPGAIARRSCFAACTPSACSGA